MNGRVYNLLILTGGFFLLLNGSCSVSNDKVTDISTDSLLTEPAEVVLDKDTLIQEVAEDEFSLVVKRATDSLNSWGFELQKEPAVFDPESYRYHWYLKHYMRPNHHARDTMPSQEAFSQFTVRQAEFKKQWKFIIEEWKFESRDQAESWMHIIIRNYRMDDQKPPREIWLDDNRIYFVVATAAKDWFEHGKELVSLLTDRELSLIRLLYYPMDVVEFKRNKGSSNSGNSSSKHRFTPTEPGIHYYYSLFRTPWNIPEYKRLGGLVVETYKFAEVAGDYFDEDEILIGIFANYSDRDLGRMNWVKKPVSSVKDQLGNPQYENAEQLVYYHAQRLLSFRIMADSVAEFRFRITDNGLGENTVLDYTK